MNPGLRYHIASLAAVFLALTVGLLIGGLFLNTAPTTTQDKLINRIQGDIETLTKESNANKQALERNREFIKALAPALHNSLMKTRSVSVVMTGDDTKALDETISAVRDSGAKLNGVIQITDKYETKSPRNRQNLIDDLRLAYPNLPNDNQAIIRCIANSAFISSFGPIRKVLSDAGIIDVEGTFSEKNTVILLVGGNSTDSGRVVTLDKPMISIWKANNLKVAATERSDAAYSHISTYRESKIAVVDCIDTLIGRLLFNVIYDVDPMVYGITEQADLTTPKRMDQVLSIK
ncbi:MAG: copper transporter [Armatimonadota bacterium]